MLLLGLLALLRARARGGGMQGLAKLLGSMTGKGT